MKAPVFLKPIEFAEAIGASKAKVYEMIQRKQVPSVKIAGLTRIPRAALEQFVEAAMQLSTEE
jgi:excisionase family DNA binding protein